MLMADGVGGRQVEAGGRKPSRKVSGSSRGDRERSWARGAQVQKGRWAPGPWEQPVLFLADNGLPLFLASVPSSMMSPISRLWQRAGPYVHRTTQCSGPPSRLGLPPAPLRMEGSGRHP